MCMFFLSSPGEWPLYSNLRELHPARCSHTVVQKKSATTTASITLTLFTDGDRRVPCAPKLALRLLRALQGVTKIAFEDNGVCESVHGLQPSRFSILDLWSFAADCWK